MTDDQEKSESDEYEEFRELAEAPGTKEILEAYGSTSGYSKTRTSVWFRDLQSEDVTYSPYTR